jgi:glycosyltransferase involved in cell wall biosynthesis
MTDRLGALLIGVLPLWEDRGDAIHLREVALALQARGIDPVVLCLPGPAAPDDTLRELRVAVPRRRGLFHLAWNVRGTAAAVRAIRAEGLGVVYSRLDPGLVAGKLAARLTGRPLVVEMNGLPSEDVRLYRGYHALLGTLTRRWEAGMYRAAQRIVAAPGYAAYAQQHFDVPVDKCVVTPLGVNTEVFHPRDKATCRRMLSLYDSPTIAWMGALAGWQGLQTLVEAAQRVRAVIPARVLVIGDGPARAACEAAVAERGLADAFQFTGHVPYARVAHYLGAADVCVAMFPGNRGGKGSISALKTVSYLACGRPVVTTEMDELGEAITAAGAGFAVPPDDPEALAARLAELLCEDDAARQARGTRASALVGYERTWDAAADRIAACLREVAR